MIEMRLPQFGMGMSEGQIIKWLKQEGETVQEGETIVEVEAAKTTVEVPAPLSGRLVRIIAAEGETVPVYQVIAHIGSGALNGGTSNVADPPAHEAPVSSSASPAARGQTSPRIRRLAAELSVDLSAIDSGSGLGGRITEADVHAAATGGETSFPGSGDAAIKPLSATRQLIARRMLESLSGSAQLTFTRAIDVTALVNLREEFKAHFAVSITDLLVRATALALRRHPDVNATLEGKQLRRLDDINIGLAVSLDVDLVVPVVRGADDLSLRALAAETRRLAQSARAGRLSVPELSGSTFTITSLGSDGIDSFTPILNPPELAILGLGAIREVFCRTLDAGEWRNQLSISLTVDHRVIDGRPAALFLQTIADLCADPQGWASL